MSVFTFVLLFHSITTAGSESDGGDVTNGKQKKFCPTPRELSQPMDEFSDGIQYEICCKFQLCRIFNCQLCGSLFIIR